MQTDFKVFYPAGYNVEDVNDDNIDVFVIFPDSKIWVATAYTVKNISYYIKREATYHFWASDLFIVKNLKKQSIRKAILETLKDDIFHLIFRNSGTIQDLLPDKYPDFDSITDSTHYLDVI